MYLSEKHNAQDYLDVLRVYDTGRKKRTGYIKLQVFCAKMVYARISVFLIECNNQLVVNDSSTLENIIQININGHTHFTI
jgi:hypothetical protein